MQKNPFRQYRIIKTPKPFRRTGCKSFYVKLTGIDGKRREVNLGTADKKEARIRAKREVDLLNSQLDGSFAKVVDIFAMLEAYFQSKTNLAESTRKRNKQHANFFLAFMCTRHADVKYFNQITQGHIEAFQDYRLNETGRDKKKVATKTVRESLYVLNNIFEWAMKRNYVHRNPVKQVDKIKVLTKDQHVFSQEQVIALLNHCKNDGRHRFLYAPYLVLAMTGLRSGELTNLTWDDLDFDRRVIKIRNKTLPDGREWTAKTKQRRELKMDDEVFDVLFELKIQSSSRWVFTNSKGNRLTEPTLWLDLISLCKLLNIPRGQVHSFRRTFACMMDRAVHDRVAIKETLGHATMTMTDRYCGYRPKEYIDKAHMQTTSELSKKMKEAEQSSA